MNFKKLISTSYLCKSEEKKLNCPSPTGKEIKTKGQKCPFDPKITTVSVSACIHGQIARSIGLISLLRKLSNKIHMELT